MSATASKKPADFDTAPIASSSFNSRRAKSYTPSSLKRARSRSTTNTPSSSKSSCNSKSLGPQIIPPDEYYDQTQTTSSSSKSSSKGSGSLPKTPENRNPDSTALIPKNPEGDSGHGDFEDDVPLSSISSPSFSFPDTSIFDSESDETESLCSCSNSCCSGSYTRSESCSRSCSGSVSETETETDTVNTRTLSKSYRAYLRRIQKLKKTLANWDRFLSDNGISRPDFFCRYKERESLQQIVDEFHEVTQRHREGFLGAIREAKWRERQRRNSCRNRKIRKLLARGSLANSRANSSRDSGNDASSSNEAAHLQQRLKNLSSELVTLRNRLHVNGQPPNGTAPHHPAAITNGPPHVPPHVIPLNGNNVSNSLPPIRTSHHQLLSGHGHGGPILPPAPNNTNGNGLGGYPNKPLPPHPPSHHNNNNILHSNNNNHNLNSHHLNNNNNSSGNNNSHSNTVNNNNNLNNHHNNSNNNSASNGYYVNQHFPKDVMRGGNCGGALENGKLVVGGGGGSAGSVIGTTATTTSGEDATPSESSYKLSTKSAPTTLLTSTSASHAHRTVRLADIEDLIHLSGPLTEDALIRCLQARCSAAKYYAYMGPILLMANPLNGVGNPLTLTSTKAFSAPPPVQKIVQEALRQQGDTGYPQAIILSGCSGSGKTYTSMLVLRQLFELAGGGMETDAYKHLAASITVLRSLGTARTAFNTESSRIGHFIEVQVTDSTVYRTKVHCYFLDQSRVVNTAHDEKNYHIFYQMLAGLSAEERSKLHLRDHRVETLRYLNSADPRTDETEDARRFLEWKASLGVLGIPFLDVVRVLTAVILIGNVKFVESASCMEMEVEGEPELQAAANLLGVSEQALKQGLTTRTHNVRNQFLRSRCDANMSNFTRDALAKSLYCRTVATIVRRANSLKRLGSTSGTLSSDSTDSVHNQAEVASQHASTVGTAGSKASKSMTALNNAVRQSTDGFIGILDMFGFEDVKPSHLEHLCVNLCAETMQHFYNTHIFKACIESCRDEGIQCDWEVDYVDNVPCIDLISSLRTGLLSMLDVECSVRGTVESYIQKVRSQHKTNARLLESKCSTDLRSFAIQHYAGKVTYDATEFLETNRDVLADDLVAVFHKHRCSFGFASHLFSSELKILGAGGMEPSPRGISFRISPTSHTELLNGDEPVSTLTQDFHTRLDNLLRTLVHARPHFIRCIKINHNEQQDLFDRHTVSKQIRAFQVLETVNLMANGYPHRMRFKAFNARYKLLAPFHQLSRTDDRATEDCQLILECFDNSLDSCVRERLGHISISWALGKRHIFLSEGARQQLEALRTSTRNRAATTVQSTWRGWHCRQRWPIVRQGFHLRFQNMPPPVPPPNVVSNPCGLLTTATAIQPLTISTATTNTMNNQHSNVTPSNANLNHANIAINSHTISLRNNGNSNSGTPNAAPNTSISHMQMMSGSQAQQAAAAAVAVASMAAMLGGSLSPNIPNVPIPAPRTSTSANMHNMIPPNSPSNTLPNIPPGNNTVSVIPNANGSPSISSSCNSNTGGRPRPQPIAGTPPPDAMERCDAKLVQQTCNMFGLDMERPPPLPPSRSYTVAGNTKLGYPQTRVMKMTFPDEGTTAEIRLLKGDTVMVVGASPRRGHLMVEHKNRTIHVPFQYLELKAPQD